MTTHNLAFLGFGNVGRALAALVARQREALRERYGVEYRITGVASRRGGWWAAERGLDPAAPAGMRCDGAGAWLAGARPAVVFETLPLDPHSGEPALGFTRQALAAGAHVVSANKGPVVHGYQELMALAAARGVRYRFESAVMDGAPVFSLVRRCLPLAELTGVRGLFTSTSTVALEAVQRGSSLADGIAEARRLGVAEADPSYDVDGWDSAVKLCAIAVVLFGHPLRPAEVERAGIGALDADELRRAAAEGEPYRLVGRLTRVPGGDVVARVAPERVARSDPIGAARGTDLVLTYDSPIFPGGLTVVSRAPDLTTTAYGLFADFLDVIGVMG